MQSPSEQLNKTIIDYIPVFLKYCETKKNHTATTIKNYQHFLNRFIEWLRLKKLSNLKPKNLSPVHIQEYKLYLSRKSLKKTTQSYYLIALRALLSYFVEKGITSLSVNKINLIWEFIQIRKMLSILK